MEIYQLRYFAYAAKYENITMAAQELNVSRAATYKTLDDMPERLRKALPDMKKMMDLLKNKEE